MQITTSGFDSLASGHVRPLICKASAAFNKAFDSNVTFFTLNQSVLNGSDILASANHNVITEWDKYAYEPITNRIVSMEITREEDEPYSVARAYADLVLNNYDDYFTPGGGSPIANYMVSRRPFRLFMGFGNEALPQMVGLSDGPPEIDRTAKTATFHIIDFLSYLYDQDVSESVILQGYRTDEILAYLLQLLGVSSSQYDLTPGTNKVSFFFVEKGQKFGDVAFKLMEAEAGRLYMDEQGIIKTRGLFTHYASAATDFVFDSSNIIDYKIGENSTIVNSGKVTASSLEVQDAQSIWTSASKIVVGAGKTVTVWAEFGDPVTSAQAPIYSAAQIMQSFFTSSSSESGDIPSTDISLSSIDVFGKSAKLTFTNAGTSIVYIQSIDLWGVPAKAVQTITAEVKDQSSIDDYEEQHIDIDNPYLQSKRTAVKLIKSVISEHKSPNDSIELEVKGNMAQALGDKGIISIDGIGGTWVIRKITNIIDSSPRFIQKLRLTRVTDYSFFTLNQSVLSGTDVLAPAGAI